MTDALLHYLVMAEDGLIISLKFNLRNQRAVTPRYIGYPESDNTSQALHTPLPETFNRHTQRHNPHVRVLSMGRSE